MLRERAERYIARVATDLGPDSFWAVRIGSGSLVEALYPSAWDGGRGNSYWAYDAAAQGGYGRPDSIPPAPYPGWRPGQTSYNGRNVSTAQVREWYDWYLGALVDGIRWQVNTYNLYGYTGHKQILMPGLGSRPAEYEAAISSRLNGDGDPYGNLARGAAWNRVLDRLADIRGIVAYVSS
ncbi:MAG: hypothetical protein M3492_13790, partial [Actinomycetota bacterium]|nr:hypothetical protein [Actinomycetota bacterium]